MFLININNQGMSSQKLLEISKKLNLRDCHIGVTCHLFITYRSHNWHFSAKVTNFVIFVRLKFETRKSSCGKRQEAYRQLLNLSSSVIQSRTMGGRVGGSPFQCSRGGTPSSSQQRVPSILGWLGVHTSCPRWGAPHLSTLLERDLGPWEV